MEAGLGGTSTEADRAIFKILAKGSLLEAEQFGLRAVE
jgi:hypothetical protein